MSLITEAYGNDILAFSKAEVIKILRVSKFISPGDRAKYLRDWGAATNTVLTGDDFNQVMSGEF